jgi:phosphoenolpyruvate carboxylase
VRWPGAGCARCDGPLLLGQAAARWPDQWRSLAPLPLRFATWVGYDMDGRTDIGWATSLRYRLIEKAERLGRYADALAEAAPEVADRLRAAAGYSKLHGRAASARPI